MNWTARAARRAAQVRKNGSACVFSGNLTFSGYISRRNVELGTGTEEDGDPAEFGFLFTLEPAAFGQVLPSDTFTHEGQQYEVVQVTPQSRGDVVLLTHLLCRTIRALS